MAEKRSKKIVDAGAYATSADFKQIFIEDVNSLYLLSLLLTGSPEKAEECFVEGFEESTKENRVFKEWARSWVRRTIIQTAIRLVAPRKTAVPPLRAGLVVGVMHKVPAILQMEVCAILALTPLERIVFVVSVLERYPDHDCSILLGCARGEIAAARARAMQQLGMLLGTKNPPDSNSEKSAATENTATTTLMIAQYLAQPALARAISQ